MQKGFPPLCVLSFTWTLQFYQLEGSYKLDILVITNSNIMSVAMIITTEYKTFPKTPFLPEISGRQK